MPPNGKRPCVCFSAQTEKQLLVLSLTAFDPKETFEAVHSAHRPLARARQLKMTRYRALVCRLSMISRQTVPPFRVMLEAAVQRGCLPSMPRFASCVQNGASRTIFPAALFIVVGMADRSAARIPSRQA